MPASIKLQETYGQDLQVILVESQGASRGAMEAFAERRDWLENDAMWTTERPFKTGSRSLPNFVLVGADGTVIEKGSHTGAQTVNLIEREIEAGRAAGARDSAG